MGRTYAVIYFSDCSEEISFKVMFLASTYGEAMTYLMGMGKRLRIVESTEYVTLGNEILHMVEEMDVEVENGEEEYSSDNKYAIIVVE